MITEKYTLISTQSGYAVRRHDGSYAEFLDSAAADEAKAALDRGASGASGASESDYEWTDA